MPNNNQVVAARRVYIDTITIDVDGQGGVIAMIIDATNNSVLGESGRKANQVVGGFTAAVRARNEAKEICRAYGWVVS